MKIFKIYYLSSNDFFNAQIVSNLASGNSFKGLWHFFTIWQYMMLHALSCNYPGYNLGYTFPYTPTHPVNCQQILEVIGLYDPKQRGKSGNPGYRNMMHMERLLHVHRGSRGILKWNDILFGRKEKNLDIRLNVWGLFSPNVCFFGSTLWNCAKQKTLLASFISGSMPRKTHLSFRIIISSCVLSVFLILARRFIPLCSSLTPLCSANSCLYKILRTLAAQL